MNVGTVLVMWLFFGTYNSGGLGDGFFESKVWMEIGLVGDGGLGFLADEVQPMLLDAQPIDFQWPDSFFGWAGNKRKGIWVKLISLLQRFQRRSTTRGMVSSLPLLLYLLLLLNSILPVDTSVDSFEPSLVPSFVSGPPFGGNNNHAMVLEQTSLNRHEIILNEM